MKISKILIIVLVISITGNYKLNSQNQLIIPDTLSGNSFELTLQNGNMQFIPGLATSTMGVNGDILGPTLIMEKDEFVDITVNNNLLDTTTIHWHGMHVSAENDGGPHTLILPGGSWNPSFTVLDKAGTYWYHPHLHEKTNKHVSMGIAGVIIVRDNEEAALNLPRTYGVDDFPLVIQTKEFTNDNEIVTPTNSDDVVMVNATIDANLTVPSQVVRFRLLNGSSQRVFNVGLSNNQTFYQIASDGGLLGNSNAISRLKIAPGERAEILVDFGGLEGQSISLLSYASEFSSGIYGASNPGMMSMMSLDGYNPNPINGADFNLLQFNITGQTSNPVTTIPSGLVTIVPILESSAEIYRSIVFTPEAMGQNQLNGMFLINGSSFDMNVINYTIPLNSTEIWTITNQSAISHPFHIHDVQFYVLDRDGNPPPASEQGRKDVILVGPMESVRFITKFEDFVSENIPYMYHCHMLVHEDGGMMGQFVVVDPTNGIDDDRQQNGISIFPNPILNEEFAISFKYKEEHIIAYEIYSITGIKIKSKTISNKVNQEQVKLYGIPDGAYIFKIYSNRSEYSELIIKN